MTADREKLYEGKAKILYKGPDAGTLIQYFKDDATAFNAQKKAVLDGKGVLNNLIVRIYFQPLARLVFRTISLSGFQTVNSLSNRFKLFPSK